MLASLLNNKKIDSSSTQQDGTKVISGGADKAARVFDVTTGQTSQVAQHDAPIKCIKWIDAQGQGLIATGSWDKVKLNLILHHE